MKNKIKNVFLTIGIFLLTKVTNTYASTHIAPVYGVEPIKEEKVVDNVDNFKYVKFFIIPLVFIIGSIIYLNKSKSSKKRKIITILIALLLTIGICFGIDYFINK